MIINRNLQGEESLSTEKLCSVLFGAGRLKITMKHHAACCACQDYSGNLCPCAAEFQFVGCRLFMSGLENKTL